MSQIGIPQLLGQVGFGTPPILPPVNEDNAPDTPGSGPYRRPDGTTGNSGPYSPDHRGGGPSVPPGGQNAPTGGSSRPYGPSLGFVGYLSDLFLHPLEDAAATTGVYALLVLLFVIGLLMLFLGAGGAPGIAGRVTRLRGNFTAPKNT